MVRHQQLNWRVKSVRVPLGHDPAKRQFVIGSQQYNDQNCRGDKPLP